MKAMNETTGIIVVAIALMVATMFLPKKASPQVQPCVWPNVCSVSK